jgi:hypothetical protein
MTQSKKAAADRTSDLQAYEEFHRRVFESAEEGRRLDVLESPAPQPATVGGEWECWTCAYASCDPITGLTDETLPNTPLALREIPYRGGLPDLRSLYWHRKRGHDVRPVGKPRVHGHHAECASVQAFKRGERSACNCEPVGNHGPCVLAAPIIGLDGKPIQHGPGKHPKWNAMLPGDTRISARCLCGRDFENVPDYTKHLESVRGIRMRRLDGGAFKKGDCKR